MRSLEVSWHNHLTVGLKKTPHHFLQVRRRNRSGDNKNAYYNIDMAFSSKQAYTVDKKEAFFQCFSTKNFFVLVNGLLVLRYFWQSQIFSVSKKFADESWGDAIWKPRLRVKKFFCCFEDKQKPILPKLNSIFPSAISATAFW